MSIGTNEEIYTIPGVLHFIQHEWDKFEIERSQWVMLKAELQNKIIYLEEELLKVKLQLKSHKQEECECQTENGNATVSKNRKNTSKRKFRENKDDESSQVSKKRFLNRHLQNDIQRRCDLKREPLAQLSINALKLHNSASKSVDSVYHSALEENNSSPSTEKENVRGKNTLSEFDKVLLHDPLQVSLYAMEIFEYLKSREANFACENYMIKQTDINENMRAVLVDWLVEVQAIFELNHETIYLAVKLFDNYFSKVQVVIPKEKLQLVGAAAMLISCKYESRELAMVDDFIYFSDNAFTRDDLLDMERRLLIAVNFELGFPISYRFLRRYARCIKLQLSVLTLARYILELALMNYKTVTLSDSKQAAAALYLTLKMVKHDDWTEELVRITGYKKSDFKDIVLLFNNMLHQEPSEELKTIRTKYSHESFFQVAKTRLIDDTKLDLDS